MTALILNWRQAYQAGVLTCGGKGYQLAKLQRYGFPVPDGGVAEVRAVAAQPWATLGNDAMLQLIARMVELHECLDLVIGFSNGYASALKNLLDAQLREFAGERAPGLMARLLAGSTPGERHGLGRDEAIDTLETAVAAVACRPSSRLLPLM